MTVEDGFLGSYLALVMLRRVHGEALLRAAVGMRGRVGLVAFCAARGDDPGDVAEALGITPAEVEELAQSIELKGL